MPTARDRLNVATRWNGSGQARGGGLDPLPGVAGGQVSAYGSGSHKGPWNCRKDRHRGNSSTVNAVPKKSQRISGEHVLGSTHCR